MMSRYKHSSYFGKAISRALLGVISHNSKRGISMIVKSLCRGCHQTFDSVAAFDFHHVGSYGEANYDGTSHRVVGYTPRQRRCLSVEEMVALGMTKNAKGWWQMPARVKAVAGITPGEVSEEEEELEGEAEREVA